MFTEVFVNVHAKSGMILSRRISGCKGSKWSASTARSVELVPPPGKVLEFEDGIAGPAGRRSVLGFLYWLGHESGAAEAPSS